jgi:hypothetical protein
VYVFSGQRSFINFEVLPVVEFKIAPGISTQEAIQVLSIRLYHLVD